MVTLIRTAFIALGLMLTLSHIQLAKAQTNTVTAQEPKTKLESFQRPIGTIIIQRSSLIEIEEGVWLRPSEFTDVTSGKRQVGIVIEVGETKGGSSRSTKSFIDYDEIDPLIKAIDSMSKVNNDGAKFPDFEATYRTRGDLSVSAHSYRNYEAATVKGGHLTPVNAHLSLEGLSKLRDMLIKSKQKLDSLR
jgi:hypothetical protein